MSDLGLERQHFVSWLDVVPIMVFYGALCHSSQSPIANSTMVMCSDALTGRLGDGRSSVEMAHRQLDGEPSNRWELEQCIFA
jgi:hypothetical protein